MIDSYIEMTEKRKFHRWPCSFSCDTNIDSKDYKGTVRELSYGGARVVPAAALPVQGANISLTIFPAEDEKGTRLMAKVAHVSEEKLYFVVQFFNNSDKLTDQLSAIIDKKLAIHNPQSFSL